MNSQENLRLIVQKAQCDKDAFRVIRRQTNGILTHLGMEPENADKWVKENIENKKIKDLTKWEADLHSQLDSFGVYKNLEKRMTERAHEWMNCIKPYLLKGKTLDLGGGSGEVAKLMADTGCDMTVADALNWVKTGMPFMQVKNNKVSAKDGAFDQVVVLTAFHHTDDVSALAKEAFRLAKKRVIFIESVTENQIGYNFGAWIDWFYNRIVHFSANPKNKINVPCNFMPAAGWEKLVLKLTGLKPTVSKNLGIFQFLNPENHHLFVYDKK